MEKSPDPRMVEFFETKVLPVLKNLDTRKFRLSGIQFRYNWCIDEIRKKYAIKSVEVELRDELFDYEVTKEGIMPLTFGSRHRSEKGPAVVACIPALESCFNMFRRSRPNSFQQVFENYIVISFLHELDHIALDLLPRIKFEDGFTLQEMIALEKTAWAETCEYTIALFAEVHREEIDFSNAKFYSAWVDCGRNLRSQKWHDFIAGIYGHLRKKPGAQ